DLRLILTVQRPWPSLSHFLYFYAGFHRLHSFPTRRSSDLVYSSARASLRCSGSAAMAAISSAEISPATSARPLRSARATGCGPADRKSTRLNSSHEWTSYAVFCLKKKTLVIQHASRRQAQP